MKKTIFAVLVVLLALSLVTCDLFPPSGAIGTGLNTAPAPEGFVTLTIGVGAESRARALTNVGDVAEDASDFFEVVFKYGTDYYRSTATFNGTVFTPNPWTINVPQGDYDAAPNAAVIFAGTNSGKVLLGIGEIDDVDSTGTKVIGPSSSVATFVLEALEAGVTTVGTAGAGVSSFLISTPTASPGTIPTETVNTVAYPRFDLPTVSTAYTATYTIGITTSAYLGHIIIGSPLTLSIDSYTGAGATTLTGSAGNTGTIAPDANFNTASSENGQFNITINASANPGFAKLTLQVPVTALAPATSTPTPQAWVIQGGPNNAALDVASAPAGGGILLRVGPSVTTITIDPGY